ncbi:unnamed protein product [Paramecium octaurelia]|uniref:Uncharacterized protein n=1 Tax=Paramecium octaurelia TaxID=43137 RepID=A0A8S1YRZ4_PAROT|nr:unnamed protein product [Paramecium octaurelia]
MDLNLNLQQSFKNAVILPLMNDTATKCEQCLIQSNKIYYSSDSYIGCYDTGVENCDYSCLACISGNANSFTLCFHMGSSNMLLYNNTRQCLFGYLDD